MCHYQHVCRFFIASAFVVRTKPSPPLLLLGSSSLVALSLSLFPLCTSLSSFFLPHFLLSTLVQHYMVSFSFFLSSSFCISAFSVLACSRVCIPSPLSLPLCVCLHLAVLPVVKIDAPAHPEFLTERVCSAGFFISSLEMCSFLLIKA